MFSRFFRLLPAAAMLLLYAPVSAQDGVGYIELTQKVIDCAEKINESLGSISDAESCKKATPEVKCLVDEYVGAVGELGKREVPSDTKAMIAYFDQQKKMRQLVMRFDAVRSRLYQLEWMSDDLKEVLDGVRERS